MNGDEGAPPINLIDLIDRLAEPPQPVPVSMRPETAGWAVLAILALMLIGWLMARAVRHWRANAYRRAALSALEAAGDDAAAVAEILRRTALAAYPRTRVASLSGSDWLAFLDKTGGDGGFAGGPGQALTRAPYRGEGERAQGLGALAARWVRRHHAGPGKEVP